MLKKKDSIMGWTFVKSVMDEKEADLVESVLATEGIPVQRRHNEAGGVMEVYMGMTRYGINLFVPEASAELAKGLLDSEVIDMPEEEDAEENEKMEKRYQARRRGIVWTILIYLLFPIIIALIWSAVIFLIKK